MAGLGGSQKPHMQSLLLSKKSGLVSLFLVHCQELSISAGTISEACLVPTSNYYFPQYSMQYHTLGPFSVLTLWWKETGF